MFHEWVKTRKLHETMGPPAGPQQTMGPPAGTMQQPQQPQQEDPTRQEMMRLLKVIATRTGQEDTSRWSNLVSVVVRAKLSKDLNDLINTLGGMRTSQFAPIQKVAGV